MRLSTRPVTDAEDVKDSSTRRYVLRTVSSGTQK